MIPEYRALSKPKHLREWSPKPTHPKQLNTKSGPFPTGLPISSRLWCPGQDSGKGEDSCPENSGNLIKVEGSHFEPLSSKPTPLLGGVESTEQQRGRQGRRTPSAVPYLEHPACSFPVCSLPETGPSPVPGCFVCYNCWALKPRSRTQI